MNLDDPKLTAFALGEMSAQERAEWEALVREEEKARAEIEETREMAQILRNELQAEPAEGLLPHQRDAIFRAAQLAAARHIPASERPAPVVVQVPWWNRPGPWQAIAACAVFGFGIYATTMNLGRPPGKIQVADAPEMRIAVPPDAIAHQDSSGGPNLQSPNGLDPSPSRVALSPQGSANRIASSPNVQGVRPDVDLSPPAGVGNTIESAANPPGIKVSTMVAERGPRPKGTDDPRLVGASIARAADRPAIVTDEVVELALQARLKDAAGIQVGTTYGEFSKVFEPDSKVSGRYQMKRSPLIKVDVAFEAGNATPSADTRIEKISKPYLD